MKNGVKRTPDWKVYRNIETVKGRQNFSVFHFTTAQRDGYSKGKRVGFLAGVHAKKRNKSGK